MSDDRRYQDDEIAEILDLAVTSEESQHPTASADGGLTLAERLETKKGGADNVNGLALGAIAMGIVFFATIANSGSSPVAMELLMLWSFVAGLAMLGSNAFRLPRWAREREEQMEYIDLRVRALIAAESDDQGGER